MTTLIYQATRNDYTITGIVKDINPFKALFKARNEVFQRNGDIETLVINKI